MTLTVASFLLTKVQTIVSPGWTVSDALRFGTLFVAWGAPGQASVARPQVAGGASSVTDAEIDALLPKSAACSVNVRLFGRVPSASSSSENEAVPRPVAPNPKSVAESGSASLITLTVASFLLT